MRITCNMCMTLEESGWSADSTMWQFAVGSHANPEESRLLLIRVRWAKKIVYSISRALIDVSTSCADSTLNSRKVLVSAVYRGARTPPSCRFLINALQTTQKDSKEHGPRPCRIYKRNNIEKNNEFYENPDFSEIPLRVLLRQKNSPKSKRNRQ